MSTMAQDAGGYGVRFAAEAAAKERVSILRDEAERGGRDIYVANHIPIKRFFYTASSILKDGRRCIAFRTSWV